MDAKSYYYMMHTYFRRMIRAGKNRDSYLSVVYRGDPHAAQTAAAQQAIRDAH